MTLRRGTSHLTTETALDYLEGLLDAAGRARIEEHLGRPCPICHERIRELGALVERMRLDRTPEVPAFLRDRALRVFQPRAQRSPAVRLAEEIARLLFDSALQPLTATTRRNVGAARRLGYALTGGTLEVELEPESGNLHTLRGRLQIPEAELQQVEVGVGAERFLVWPGAEGGFLVEHVPAGSIHMMVTGPAGRFVIPSIELGS